MSLERYFERFERAVIVRGGTANDIDLLRIDGGSVLQQRAHPAAPSVVVGVSLSGAARPGETIRIVPGEYKGGPPPTVSHRLLRGGVEAPLDGLTFALTDEDLGRMVEVIETAENPKGRTQTSARLSVQRIAPMRIEMTAGGADVGTDAMLPLVLAELSADGTAPLNWSVSGAAGHVEIATGEVAAVLRLVSMPAEGLLPLTIRAANAAGAVEADFALHVAQPEVQAPGHISLSASDAVVAPDADLPLVLAEMSADGSAPLDWALDQAGDWFALETVGDKVELRLVAMPEPGVQTARIRVSNEAGSLGAVFDLIVTEPAVAPGPVVLSNASMVVNPDQALPMVLATVAAEGSAPLDWRAEGSAAMALIEEDGVVRLMLVEMPQTGGHTATITVENAAGSATAEFALTVAERVLPPVRLTVSAEVNEVAAEAELPLLLAHVASDGTAPLHWSLGGGEGFFALDAAAGPEARLMLVAMPPAGAYSMQIHAANSAGSAGMDYVVAVAEPRLPAEVVISAVSGEVAADAALPVTLATISAGGADDWSLEGGEGFAALTVTGETAELILTQMPQPGEWALRVHAGGGSADFALSVTAAAVAPGGIVLSETEAVLAHDSALPRLLATASAEGAEDWSLEGGEGFAVLEQDRDGVRLMLVTLPEAGHYDLLLRAANAAGAVTAGFAMTIEAEIRAPSFVGLSAEAVEIAADAALPVELASLTADGSAPLNWSVEDATGCVTLDLAGDQPRLMLVAMPEAGDWPVTVTAMNGAGAAGATLSLTVHAAEDLAPLSLSAGSASNLRRLEDGGLSFTLDGTDHDGDYLIPGAAARSGLPVILRAPVVDEESDGRFAVTQDGLYAYPAHDPASVLIEWEVDGRIVASGPVFASTPRQRLGEIAVNLTVMNLASHDGAAHPATRVVIRAAVPFAPVPMRVAGIDRDEVRIKGSFGSYDKALLMTRFRYLPQAGDASEGNVLRVGRDLNINMSASSGNVRPWITARPADTPSGGEMSSYSDTVLKHGDLVDVVMGIGYRINNDPFIFAWSRVNLGPWKSGGNANRRVRADYAVDLSGATEAIIGRGGTWSLNSAGITHEQHRTALWLGQVIAPLEAAEVFFRADGALEHPEIAHLVLGQPALDFYESRNNGGSLGQPYIATDLN